MYSRVGFSRRSAFGPQASPPSTSPLLTQVRCRDSVEVLIVALTLCVRCVSSDFLTTRTAIQVMQLGLMFVSALPIALSIISTRPADSAAVSATSSAPSRREVARQSFLHTIQFDLLLIIGALFGIAGIEAASRDPVNLWRTLYEVVSAYGTGALH